MLYTKKLLTQSKKQRTNMSDNKQTAVGWLLEYCERENWSIPNDIISYAKALEKQQIVEAFSQGYNSGENKALGIPEKSRKQFESGEQYYSQEYKQ